MRSWKHAKTTWDSISHIQIAMGIPPMLASLSAGIAAVIAATAPLAWYWRLLLFLGLAVLLLWLWNVIYAVFLHERRAKTRRVRALLLEAAAFLEQSAVLRKSASIQKGFEEITRRAYQDAKCDVLVFMALRHDVAKDYDDFVEIHEWRAKQRGEKFDSRIPKAEWFRNRAKHLVY